MRTSGVYGPQIRKNSIGKQLANIRFFFGKPGDRFIAEDWGIMDGVDTPAVFRRENATFCFRYTLSAGNADAGLLWGSGAMLPVAGEFSLP